MARPSHQEQRQDTGRNAYRTEHDPVDERPLLVWSQFWGSAGEQGAYEAAVENTPRRSGEGPMAYAQRVSAVVTGAYRQAGQAMPRRMSQRDWQRRQNAVKQAGGLRMSHDEMEG